MLERQGITLQGVQHDPDAVFLSARSDLLIASFSRRCPAPLQSQAQRDAARSGRHHGRLATALRREVEEAGLLKLYEEIDLPLVPVLARMEHAGVKIDRAALAEMSSRLEREIDAKAKEIYELARD